MRASERLAWAAGVVAPAPGQRVLEVGCGHGVLVDLLAGRPGAGPLVAVDRSATMVAAATRRNRAAIEAGRVSLQTATLATADLLEHSFDVVVSFDVRAFWTPPAPEWDVVRRVLAPGGRVLVAFSVMGPGADEAIRTAVRRVAGERGFAEHAVHRAATAPTPSAAIELRPTPDG
ncbi:class I SAM-dependent methyltransferase [Blastococcus sp. VKM Ac-2987]|uniref:class I SAM-dependent methyltransferase n=1 Tax=Blastococcus sp. VKM Ac-2987 TaxID=3004141 RepID=UPI0022AB905F|nr:class I SAM-dependent methyltransferase [Blastococcus sp. VKM Ac-2987]MCZ2857726.1 class I SAM-dependent methyltransferase [Blastococcus sp. VKM Ac-2987]